MYNVPLHFFGPYNFWKSYFAGLCGNTLIKLLGLPTKGFLYLGCCWYNTVFCPANAISPLSTRFLEFLCKQKPCEREFVMHFPPLHVAWPHFWRLFRCLSKLQYVFTFKIFFSKVFCVFANWAIVIQYTFYENWLN